MRPFSTCPSLAVGSADELDVMVARINERYRQLAKAAEAAHTDYIVLRSQGKTADPPPPSAATRKRLWT